MPFAALRDFLKLEASGGIVLVVAAAAALILANSGLAGHYTDFLDVPVAIKLGALEIDKPLLLWVNDGLMAVFFFLVGLEIKREFREGELSSASQLALPAFAALGGLALPALIYVGVNWGSPQQMNGWAIPAATDIAFALGVLALIGRRAPLSLKVLLTAIAIIDDLAAILIIAIFYTDQIVLTALYPAAAALVGLAILNITGVRRLSPYVLLGIVLWVCVLKSGVHATLAGVAAAFFIPLGRHEDDGKSLLKKTEHDLHIWVAFLILPVFAFANAGVSFAGMGLGSFTEPVTLGISLGLFFGKQLGIFAMLWLCIRLGIAPMPRNASWMQLYGVSLLCGIGFTMSLFIGSLAFEATSFDAPVRLGVLTGSIISALIGYAVFRLGSRGPVVEDDDAPPLGRH